MSELTTDSQVGGTNAPVPKLERILWDQRNRLWLCERHHRAHHARTHPIARHILEQHAPKVFQFAVELGLLPWLERMYPKVTPPRTEEADGAP